MSSSSIDQLFQVTTPGLIGGNEPRIDRGDSDLFRAHLERATDTAEPKAAKQSEKETPAKLHKDKPSETHTEHENESTAEQEEAASTSEATEQATEVADETTAEEVQADEVTLSSAAVQVVATANNESTPVAETLVEVVAVTQATSADQKSSNGQFTGNFVETTQESSATNQAYAEEVTAVLQTNTIDSQATAEETQLAAELPAETNAEQQTVADKSIQSAIQSEKQSDVHLTQHAEAQSSSQKAHTVQPHQVQFAEKTLEKNSDEKTSKRFKSSGKEQLTNSSAAGVIASTEAELAKATQNATSEVSTTSSTQPATNESVSVADRSFGSLAASKLADQTNGAEKAASTSESPTVDPARFVRRVSGAIRSAQQRDGQIQLRLSPPELGTLRIQLTVNEGGITAQLETETSAARTLLLDNLPALRERLAEQGMTIEKFDVDVGQEGQQQTENRNAEQRAANQSQSKANRSSKQDDNLTSTETKTAPASIQHPADNGLDIRI